VTTVRKTGSDQAGSLRVHAMAAERFPLIPRAKPICQAMDIRVARVRELADLAGQGTEGSLVRAAEAQNLAALILSDCGLPDLARELSWQQFEVFLTKRLLDTVMAKLALQPLINLGRLLIRGGDGTAAYQLLEALFKALKSRTDAVIDGRKIALAGLIGPDDAQREVLQWMWAVLLNDGTRALTRAGRWTEALQHVQRHKGIGDRLFDGRQVAILASASTGHGQAALHLLADSSTPTPWEQAVASCVSVLCGAWAGRPSESDITTMIDRYLALQPAPEHVVFHVRLGLCVIDLASGDRRAQPVADTVLRAALDAADAYAAREALSHQICLKHTRTDAAEALTDTVRAAGLVTPSDLRRAALDGPVLDSLLNSAKTAKHALATLMLQPSHH
jgi:hypothetical protein